MFSIHNKSFTTDCCPRIVSADVGESLWYAVYFVQLLQLQRSCGDLAGKRFVPQSHVTGRLSTSDPHITEQKFHARGRPFIQLPKTITGRSDIKPLNGSVTRCKGKEK
ncbi:hypothetical protein RRG08_055669 [Elysia crispata]|uniref:Uncharacterized protein n=1 Tax=Elysia crispata TaxID=231223 RepID=A0AAE1DBF3_9GAST|nr:hypothetical protein RRG08_055669 [Elysia crispata]